MSGEIELTIVVNGQPTQVKAHLEKALESVIPTALEQTGNSGQPPSNWELRDSNGEILPLEHKVETFHFAPGTTLFLNLKAGIGG
jgi:Protein of Unknown function (DUF2604)